MDIVSSSAEQTESIAEIIGSNLRGGEVIELISDLGGGKTTFTRGLARGLDVKDVVSSPTFTISREYSGRLKMYHFDFYRLASAGVVGDEIAEVIGDSGGVVVIEWAEVVSDLLPKDYLRINITVIDDSSRNFNINCSDNLKYLTSGLL